MEVHVHKDALKYAYKRIICVLRVRTVVRLFTSSVDNDGRTDHKLMVEGIYT